MKDSSEDKEQLPDLKLGANKIIEQEIVPKTDKAKISANLVDDGETKNEDPKEKSVSENQVKDRQETNVEKPEIDEENESLVERDTDSSQVATISKELSEIKKLGKDLKALEKTIPETSKKKRVSLKHILKGFKVNTKNLDLKKIRKQGKLSVSDMSQATEVITKNSALFAKGKSKIIRNIPKLSVLQHRTYLQEIDNYIRDKWKLPAELSANLMTKVKLVIAKDGTLLQYSLVKVSGNRIFDQSIKSLFSKLETLPALPENFEGKLTEIGLKFSPL